MDPSLFTDIVSKQVGRSKPSEIIPLINIIASEWGLNCNKLKHFTIAKRILINSVKNN